jgi:outer membrane protein TolC
MTAALLAFALLAQQPATITLGEAVARATADAPALALAALRSETARARERQARAAWLPGVAASAGWLNRSFNRASLGFTFPTAPGQPAPPDLVGPFDVVDARIRATQALFDWSATARVRAARAQRASVEAETAVAAEAVAHAAALAYLRATRAAALVAARVADSGLAADLARLTEAQVAAGVAPAIDATRARTQLVAAREGVVVAQAEQARAVLELGRVLSLDPGAAPTPADTLGPDLARSAVPLDVHAATALALARRPDLAAEQARGAAATRAAAAVGAERLPRLELALDYGVNGPTATDFIGTGQVGVQLTVPLFDGLRRESRVAEQRIAARESDVRLRDGERQVRVDVAAALLELRATDAQTAIALERVRLGETEVTQARERFAAGVAGHIEVITAQLGLLDARDAWINARYAAAAARVALARAAGTARTLQ